MAFVQGDGARDIQDRFDSRRLADAITSRTLHETLSESDRAFVERMDMFFLATQGADGGLDCSYKGGQPGFIRVVDERTLAFPHYDGNGQFMSTGNILETGKVGMLFIDWPTQWRMRVNGTATIDFDDPLKTEWPEAQFVVRVHTEEVFPNCPRYVHKMELVEHSVFVPKEECATPDPDWKRYFEDDLPEAQRQRRASQPKE
ncbi:MAG: pyridoxamine 5'-phosphate oxidase family protein [Dehalococcoidia bacterium]|nr:pyridoxamine 5'-phosphate oxidase family protein [Dehalococcoidia bacterium]